jgi:hypothetical protein
VTKPIFYLSPSLINQELDFVLQASSVETRHKLKPNSQGQRQLIAYVLRQLRWLYNVMITDEKNLEQTLGRSPLSYPAAQRHQVRDLIQEGLARLPIPAPKRPTATPGQGTGVFEVF